MWYLLSTALQVAGAGLLLVRICFISIDKQLEYKHAIDPHLNGSNLTLSKQKDSEYVATIWMTRFSFGFLVFGYFISVFSEKPDICMCCSALLLLAFSGILILAGFFASKWLGKKRAEV